MMETDASESLCFFGTCGTLLEADLFIHAKTQYDGWWVMVPPFLIGPREAGFVLHKFW